MRDISRLRTVRSLVSLQFNSLNNQVTDYVNGISLSKPVSFTPSPFITEKVDGHTIKIGTVVIYASVCCADPDSQEFDPGPEKDIMPEPAVNAISYQKSVTFRVSYLTPLH